MSIEVDNLFEALDIVIDERLKDVNFDTTQICVIVDDTHKKNGKYTVTPNNGDTKFEAYSESSEHNLGDTVRVLIPNGDFSQKKFIEGKYVVDESTSPLTYVSPLKSVVDITGNLLSEEKRTETYGLVTNGPTTQIPVWSADLSQNQSFQDMQANGVYNTLILSANFKTLLNNLKVRGGTFGLKLDAYIKLQPKSTQYIVRSVKLDSSEMFGDPYNFMLYSQQSKLFSLNELGAVDKLTLYFYQNNDFVYYNGNKNEETGKIIGTTPIPYNSKMTNNLFITDVSVSFGSDLSLIQDNTLTIFSKDNLSYNSTTDPKTNEKDIGFLWYNKTDTNDYIGFSDGLVDFEYDDENIVMENCVDKNGNPIMINETDADGNIVYTQKKDAQGNPLETTVTVDGQEVKIPDMEPKQIQKKVPKIIHYDEIDFLEKSDESNRLSAYLGQEGVPSTKEALKLAADISDLKVLLEKIYGYITKDLVKTLRDYKARVEGVKEVTDLIDFLLKNPDDEANATNNLMAVYKLLDEKRTSLYDLYTNFLNYFYVREKNIVVDYSAERIQLAKDYKDGKIATAEAYQAKLDKLNKEAAPHEAVEDWLSKTTPPDYFTQICNYIESSKTTGSNQYTGIIDLIENFISEAEDKIDEFASGSRGTHDTYAIRLRKILQNIKDLLKNEEENDEAPDYEKEAKEIMSGNYELMKTYEEKEHVEYVPADFSNKNNRYSIYWYRYEPGYEDLSDRFKRTDWRRLKTKLDFGLAEAGDSDANDDVYNFGLPTEDDFIERDGKYYFSNKSFVSMNLLKRLMSQKMEQEKYQIILFHDHNMYESEELVFTNLDPVVNEQTADSTNALTITHGDQSQDVYQSYGMDNYLVNLADANTIRTLEVKYDGTLGDNDQLQDAQIYWYVPNGGTMLTVDTDYLVEQGFFNEGSGALDEKFHMDGYDFYYKTIGKEEIDILKADGTPSGATKLSAKVSDLQFFYQIKRYFVPTHIRNMIICKVFVGQEKYQYEADTFIKFNSYGTSGTDYTLAVYPNSSKIGVTASDTIENETYLELDTVLFDYNNKELNISKTIGSATDAHSFDQKWLGPTVFKDQHIEKRENGGNIAGYKIFYPDKIDNYYAVLDTKVTCPIHTESSSEQTNEDESVVKGRTVDLHSYYAIPYSKGDYYIEGATLVVYDSLGTNPAYYKDPYKIFTTHTNVDLSTIMLDGDQKDVPRYDIQWKIKYYKNKSKKPEAIEEYSKEYNMSRNSMPIIENNCLKPCNMYVGDENGNPFCYCSVECYVADKNNHRYNRGGVKPQAEWTYDLYWIQPIIIIQNRYPSAMLNSWDGGLTIDEKNGTILSTLIGAGRKTRQNTFEGVLLGDIGAGADMDLVGNKSDLGLYGFNDGAQSFGFNVDGTGFIGKAGRGRINFDGNSGTIASASRQQTTSENGSGTGMLLDLDDGYIDILGGTSYTKAGDDWKQLCIALYKLKLKKLVEKNKINEEKKNKMIGFIDYANVDDLLIIMQRVKAALVDENIKALFINYYTEIEDSNKKLDPKDKQYYALAPLFYMYALSTVENLDKIETIKEEHKITLSKKIYRQILMEMSYTQKDCKELLDDEEITLDIYQKLLLKTNFIEFDTYDVYVNGSSIYPAFESILDQPLNGQGELYKTSTYVSGYEDEEEEIPILEAAKSHVHIDVKTPYFYIISEQGKRIINIGDNTGADFSKYPYKPDENGNVIIPAGKTAGNWLEPYGKNLIKGYYLKSNNFAYTDKQFKDGTENGEGSGFLLDLTNGEMNAYNLSIVSKNLIIDSTPGAKASLVIKDNDGCNLFYASPGSKREDGDETKPGPFYLQSHTYSRYIQDKNNKDKADEDKAQPDGMKLDIANGNITAYDFSIKGYAKDDNKKNKASYIELASDPKIIVHLEEVEEEKDGSKTSYNVDLLKITDKAFQIKSKDYKTKSKTTITETVPGKGTTKAEFVTDADKEEKKHSTRKGAGVNFGKAASVDANKTFDLLAEAIGKTTGGTGTWYKIGAEQWIYAGKIDVTEAISTKTIEKKIDYDEGLIFDVNKGYIKALKDENALQIKADGVDYPIQIGTDGTYNLKLGWDGSIKGGSTYKWSITADGTATFDNLISNGGELNNATIENATITSGTITNATITSGTITNATITDGTITSAEMSSCTITDNLIYDGKTCTFTSLETGYYDFETSNVTAVTSIEVKQALGLISKMTLYTTTFAVPTKKTYVSRTYEILTSSATESAPQGTSYTFSTGTSQATLG